MGNVIDWLTGLPIGTVYLVMGVIAAVENIFPPVPADTVVAFGSWLAARGQGSVVGAFLVTFFGNVAGAAAMYFVGRRHGAAFLRRRFPSIANPAREEQLRALYGKYGVAALVVSRFIPGVRALVPPFAGALHIPALAAIGAMAVASAVWYGFISYVAFKAGAEWSVLARTITRSGTVVATAAVVLLLVGTGIWFLKRRRASAR